jgi:hypothetical protein
MNCSRCPGEKTRTDFHEAPGRKKPVRSICRRCRSEEYFARRYTTACGSCVQLRRLNANGMCRECTEAAGLRECTKCRELLPVGWFYGGKRRCVDCYRSRSSAKAISSAVGC